MQSKALTNTLTLQLAVPRKGKHQLRKAQAQVHNKQNQTLHPYSQSPFWPRYKLPFLEPKMNGFPRPGQSFSVELSVGLLVVQSDCIAFPVSLIGDCDHLSRAPARAKKIFLSILYLKRIARLRKVVWLLSS